MSRRTIQSPVGPLVLVTTGVGVAGLGWDGGTTVDDLDDSAAAAVLLDRAAHEIHEYFDGRRRDFDVPIDRRGRRGFRGEVLDVLETIPFGSTVTYGELAARAGRPRAARAVGTAMATNPIAVLVPCHRVLPAGGGVGNYGGGANAKATLLRLEGWLDDGPGL